MTGSMQPLPGETALRSLGLDTTQPRPATSAVRFPDGGAWRIEIPSVEGVEPRRYGSHWAGQGVASPALSTTFVSASADAAGIRQRLGSRRRFMAVRGTRQISRDALLANTAVAPVQVDPADGTVRLRGRVLRTEPVSEVPLSRRYLLG